MEKKWSKAGAATATGKFVCIATFLPVRRWRDILGFIRMSVRVESQLKETPGIIRYGLKTNLPRRRFWTLTIWNSRQPVNAFVAAKPHQTAVERFEKWAGSGAAFVEWESYVSEPSWDEALERLKNPTFQYDSHSR